MNRRRLDRLGALTQGAALVGLGFLAASGAACGKKESGRTNGPPFEPIHVNGPPIQQPTAPSVAPTPSTPPAGSSTPKAL